MPPFLRLLTVHPLLVHGTIGALPIFLLAYLIAAIRHSERWSFAGDVALGIGAVVTIGTGVFGLVSFVLVGWPGGLALWRWLHLGLGIGAAVLWWCLAGVRLARRRRSPIAGWPTFGVAAGVAVLAAIAGWIGGEGLVYQAGVAVAAAGQGALAPPHGRERAPRSLLDSMGLLRASWGEAVATSSRMVVTAPTGGGYQVIARDGKRLAEIARWIAREGAKTMPSPSVPPAETTHEHGAEEAEHEHGHGEREAVAGHVMTRADHLREMAQDFADQSEVLARVAAAHDLKGITTRLGVLATGCADCHLELRWTPLTTKATSSRN